MIFIISESKINSLGLEHKSDILYELIKSMYPNFYEGETENIHHLDFYSEEDGDLLFFYNYRDKKIYIGTNFLNTLYEMTGLPFLNIDNVIENRDSFDDLIKVFFKRHFGYNAEKVYLHNY